MRYSFKPLKSPIKKRKIAGFDIETYGDLNEFLMASVYYDNKFKVFWDCEEMIKFIHKNLKGYWIYATNLEFDFYGLYKNHLKKYPHKPIFRNGLIGVKMYSKRGDGQFKHPIYFLDTMNYVHFGVEKLGKIIGIEKLPTPKCFGRKPKTYEEKIELTNYNIRDSEISCKFVEWFQEKLFDFGGELETTIAKTSLDIFRRKFFFDEWFKPNKRINDFVRKGYYGGRTEAFKRGYVEKLNYYDVNSLYPSVMKLKLPNPNSAKYHEKVDERYLIYEGMINCVVECPDDLNKPFLPYRNEDDNGKLIFPSGTFKGTWTCFELRYAIQLGYKIKQFNDAVIYYDKQIYFADYVDKLYYERQECKKHGKSEQLIYKLLLNSLYGKFGQNSAGDDWLHIDSPDMNKVKPEQIIEIIDDTFVRVKSSRTAIFVQPIISAYVTAFARTLLYQYIEKYDVYYCDTDSIFTPDTVPASLELGTMKFEGLIQDVVIVKPRFYKINMNAKTYVKLKGANRINEEAWNKIVFEQLSYTKMKFMKFKESKRRHLHVNQKIEVEKLFSLEDTKRDWGNKPFNPAILQDSNPLRMLYKVEDTLNIHGVHYVQTNQK